MKAFRPTLEDTREAQRELRKMLDRLEDDDRPLEDEEEMDRFIDLCDKANLGLETGRTATLEVKAKIPRPNDEHDVREVVATEKNLARLIGELAYERRTEFRPYRVAVPGSPSDEAIIELSNSDLWAWLREELFVLWPEARKLALKSSVETGTGPEKSPEKRTKYEDSS